MSALTYPEQMRIGASVLPEHSTHRKDLETWADALEQSQPRWISIADEGPPKGEIDGVLCCNGYMSGIGSWTHRDVTYSDWVGWARNALPIRDVTYYCILKLPTLPEALHE